MTPSYGCSGPSSATPAGRPGFRRDLHQAGKGKGGDLRGEADRDASYVVAEAPLVDEDVLRRLEHLDRAQLEGGGAAAQGEQVAVQVQDRVRVVAEGRQVSAVGLRRERQPGILARPAVRGPGRPRDRGSAAVPPTAAGVDLALRRNDRILQPELLAGVEERRAPQASGEGPRPLGRCARRRRSGCGGAGCHGSTAPTSPSAPRRRAPRMRCGCCGPSWPPATG